MADLNVSTVELSVVSDPDTATQGVTVESLNADSVSLDLVGLGGDVQVESLAVVSLDVEGTEQ